jgi:uncharacterized damage-inducible protein DinB
MTWTAPPVERVTTTKTAGERQSLDEWVELHRATLLGKCADLTAEQLKERAVPPSTLTLLGLVRHMADVERWWFRKHAAEEDLPALYWRDDNEDADFDLDVVAAADAQRDLGTYRAETDACRAALAGLDLDRTVPSRGHHPEITFSVRWIYLHMIEEYARHNGHADLLRERIDGTTGA